MGPEGRRLVISNTVSMIWIRGAGLSRSPSALMDSAILVPESNFKLLRHFSNISGVCGLSAFMHLSYCPQILSDYLESIVDSTVGWWPRVLSCQQHRWPWRRNCYEFYMEFCLWAFGLPRAWFVTWSIWTSLGNSLTWSFVGKCMYLWEYQHHRCWLRN